MYRPTGFERPSEDQQAKVPAQFVPAGELLALALHVWAVVQQQLPLVAGQYTVAVAVQGLLLLQQPSEEQPVQPVKL
jgi:hypothetical protein